MNNEVKQEIIDYVLELGKDKLEIMGLSADSLDEDFDLIDSGFVNSMSFLELLEKVENQFEVEIDFDGYDPTEMTQLSAFAEVIAKCKQADTLLPCEKDGIIYTKMEKEDLQDVVFCFSNFFRSEEPLTKSMGFTTDEFSPVAERTCIQAVEHGFSLIARDKSTGKLVGFSIGKDYTQSTFSQCDEISSKFHPILELHNELDDFYQKMHFLKEGEVFLNHAMGIDLDYFKDHLGGNDGPQLNIVPKLASLTYALAEKKGFKKIIGHATSLFTQRLYKKFHFKEVFRVSYKTFSYKDDDVFRNIKWHSGCVLFEKTLP